MRLERLIETIMSKQLTYFNSIKVRLELSIVLKVIMYALFQFHKGAIRTILPVILRVVFWYFNSIKVRLEPTSPFANEKVTTFQFHKGAIRT